jgi:ATP-dependent RNA helicase DDX52/ROK1
MKSYLLKNLEKYRYRQPTPIQMQSIPVLLEGQDLLACAPTGSGKTISYVLPILHRLKSSSKRCKKKGEGCRALVVVPTRELAAQIYREFNKLSTGKKFTIRILTKTMASLSQEEGGSSTVTKSRSHCIKCDILITTPLRLVYCIQHDLIRLDRVETLVLDEADKLLEPGEFLEQIDDIVAACTLSSVQKALFSATLPPHIEAMAKGFMKKPITQVVIGRKNTAAATVRQKLVFVGQEEGKLYTIRRMLKEGLKQSIERAQELFHELIYEGIYVDVMHSDRTQAQRDAMVTNFRLGHIWVLITTDLMARGIDFKGVHCIINYDFPQSTTNYIHRIGRTGRAGHSGEAITFYTIDDAKYLRR